MARLLILLSGVVLTLLPLTFALPRNDLAVTSPPVNSTLDYLVRVLDGLDLAMSFFQREQSSVNLDAVIGTRIVEATFKVLLNKLEASNLVSHIPAFVINRIRNIGQLARDFSNGAIPYIREQEPSYYRHIGPIIEEGLFELDYESRDISQSATVWPYDPREAMDEEGSDDCLAEIFGSRDGLTCAISDKCWKRMTDFGYTGYSLSHQVFYLEIAERFGCQMEMLGQLSRQNQPSLRSLHNIYCANMFAEAEKIEGDNFPQTQQDLFMEQAAICGMIGFRDFFISEWANKVLSWQDKQDGCYKWDGWPAEKTMTRRYQSSRYRVKREEKRVSRGCLCHRTAVASGALAQYVRYILEVWLQENVEHF